MAQLIRGQIPSNFSAGTLGGSEGPYKIHLEPSPILQRRASDVTRIGPEELEIAARILRTVSAIQQNGIAIAGPQMGLSKRVIVIDFEHPRFLDEAKRFRQQDKRWDLYGPLVMFNPRIVSVGDERITWEESCLSLPNVLATTLREAHVKVVFINLMGEECTLEAEGLLAVCLQHEIDHLDGVMWWSRMLDTSKFLEAKVIWGSVEEAIRTGAYAPPYEWEMPERPPVPEAFRLALKTPVVLKKQLAKSS
jgi:peptide deformylase